MKKKALVIGSGPTGIGTALGLNNDCQVLEASSNLGGFSTSITIKGAVFDYGGHSFHTPHPEIRKIVYDALEMYDQKREARCLIQGELIDYPFQKSYDQLSNPQMIQECRDGMNNLLEHHPCNFEEYLINRFGDGIAKHFMLPYNRKLWGRDLTRLSTEWTNQRVAAPKGEKETFDTKGGHRKPLQSNTKVGYPAKGGFGEIWDSLGKKIEHVELNTKVASIDYGKKQIFTIDGSTYGYENLVSTIPINDLLTLIDGIPDALLLKAKRLDVLSLKLGLVVINHPVDTDIQRVYSSEDKIPGHKTAINHNSSDYLRSLPQHGIMMEISEGPQKELPKKDLGQWIVDSLIEMKIIKSHYEVEHVEVRHAKYAYPVPTHDKTEIIDEIQSWLNEHGIFSVGRFGQWAYINSDESFYRGIELGKRILNDQI